MSDNTMAIADGELSLELTPGGLDPSQLNDFAEKARYHLAGRVPDIEAIAVLAPQSQTTRYASSGPLLTSEGLAFELRFTAQTSFNRFAMC